MRNMYSYLIQAALFSEKGISTDELKACFQESYYTVRKLLGSIRPEMLVSGLKGKSKYYQLDLKRAGRHAAQNRDGWQPLKCLNTKQKPRDRRSRGLFSSRGGFYFSVCSASKASMALRMR